ncbi:MAG: hypothetical protein AAF703_02785 [Cyanobacteria bacterium P01_D01_bin.105]
MELQAIREKLQSLQAQPPAAETLSLPWSMSNESMVHEQALSAHADSSQERFSSVNLTPQDNQAAHRASPSRTPQYASENQSAQALAIETLKQRSRGGEAANARIDSLIAQELYRLEVQANIINEQSEKQAENILALKRSAQQASIGLRRQGIQNHPQLAIITEFLERYRSAAVPHLERDEQGYFALSYNTVNFQQAQQDAMDTADALRNRGQHLPTATSTSSTESIRTGQTSAPQDEALQDILFSQKIPAAYPNHHSAVTRSPISAGPANLSSVPQPTRTRKNRLEKSLGNTIDKVLSLFGQNKARKRKPTGIPIELMDNSAGHQHLEEGFIKPGTAAFTTDDNPSLSSSDSDEYTRSFSWLDGMIWFSGAAIARILMQTVALNYPIAQTLFVILLAGSICFALYKVVIAKSDDYSLIYRLCIVMAGLLLASLFK